MRLPILTAALAALLLAAPADARPLKTDEADGLGKALNSYLHAMGRSDATAVVTALPPRILNVFAGQTGLEAAALQKTLIEQTDAAMKGVKISDFASDQTKLNAEDATLGDGARVTWTLVPTIFTATTGGKSARNEQKVLAVREGEGWYFLRIDGPDRLQMAAMGYPFLAGLEVPLAKITPLN